MEMIAKYNEIQRINPKIIEEVIVNDFFLAAENARTKYCNTFDTLKEKINKIRQEQGLDNETSNTQLEKLTQCWKAFQTILGKDDENPVAGYQWLSQQRHKLVRFE
jgi:hypothetical protein